MIIAICLIFGVAGAAVFVLGVNAVSKEWQNED
jgi:hypothetical protein